MSILRLLVAKLKQLYTQKSDQIVLFHCNPSHKTHNGIGLFELEAYLGVF